MVAVTVASGDWFSPTIWDTGAVPSLGDKAVVNHVVYAEQEVVVGDGSLNALSLTAPLVCFKSLSVNGRVVGATPNGGLFIKSDEGFWVFYASGGIELPPVSQETLNSLWETFFGQPLTGFFFPVSGRIDKEVFLSPNYHALITPLLSQIKNLKGVVAATHDVTDPLRKINVAVDLFLSDSTLLAPHEALETIRQVKVTETAAAAFVDGFAISVGFLTATPLAVFLWAKTSLSDKIIGVKTENNKHVLMLKGSINPQEATRTLVQAQQTVGTINEVLKWMGEPTSVEISVL